VEDQAARERTSGWKSRPLWLRRLVWTGGIGVVLYLLFGIFVLPRIVERQIVSNTQAQLGLEPTMAEVRFDPIRLRLTIEEFALSEDQAEAPLLAFESMAVDLRALDFLLADAGFDEIRLVRPHVSLVVEESGELAVRSSRATRTRAAIKRIRRKRMRWRSSWARFESKMAASPLRIDQFIPSSRRRSPPSISRSTDSPPEGRVGRPRIST
jgi:uncharacterized protein involved in outer membrane biogenesis